MKRPAFQLYVHDWLSSTAIALMTPAEEGAYIHLLCHEWTEDDCGLPDDDEQLAVLSRLGRAWKSSAARLRKQFFARDGRLYNRKLLQVRAASDSYHENQRQAGKRGAEKRWGGDGEPMATPSPENGEPIARASYSSSSSSSTTSEKQDSSEREGFDLSGGKTKNPLSPPSKWRWANEQQAGWYAEFRRIYWRGGGELQARKAFRSKVRNETEWRLCHDAVLNQKGAMLARMKQDPMTAPAAHHFLLADFALLPVGRYTL